MSDYRRLTRNETFENESVPLTQYTPDPNSGRGSRASISRKPISSQNNSFYDDRITESPIPGASPNLRDDIGDVSYSFPAYDHVDDSVPRSGRFSPFQDQTPKFKKQFAEKGRRTSSKSLLTHTETIAVADDLSRDFHSGRQLRRLIFTGLVKWVITVLLIVILGLNIDYFKSKPVMTNTEKRWFNAWNTGISIALGMNIASALKQMALDLRWRILAQRPRSLREIDLLLQSDGMSSLLKIGWTTKRIQPILVCLLVFLWNLLAQIGVASVGLTYSADPTTDQAILHPDQPIWIPDLSAFSTPTDRWPDERVQQTTANNLGVSSTAYIVGNTDDPSTPLPLPNSTYESVSADYWLESNATWKYIFLDTPPVPNHPDQDPGGPQTMSIFTDRSITSNATCTAYPMTYSLENNTWTFQGNDTELLPVPPTLDFATSFQASNDVATCNGDDRTASVQVYETGHISDDDTPSAPYWFYDCCVRVSEIANATDNKPQILANMSYTAAAAIGLQGYTDYDYDLQYQVYQNETYWGYPFNGDADGLSLRMAQFAIGVFVTAGYQNPMNSTIGLQPQQGTTISFDQFTLLIVNLSLIAGLHFACFIVCAFLANRVVIPDESPLSIARSLGPLVAKLGGRGGLLSSEEIAKILDTKVLYGLVEERNEGLRICFEDVPPVRAFPNGRYV